MRNGKKPDFLTLNGQVVGVTLSSDHVAEHEWGIENLKKGLGVPGPQAGFGIDRRRIRVNPEGLRWHKFTDGSEGFGLMSHYGWEKVEKVAPPFRTRPVYPVYKIGPKKGQVKPGKPTYEGYGVAAAWDERSFLVRAAKGEETAKLREVWDAIVAGDAAIWISGGGPFGGHGLYIMIVSRIPQIFLDQMEEGDREEYEIQEYHKNTGIEKLLKDAGKNWYALIPRRMPNGLRVQGEENFLVPPGGIAWWLNPAEQRANNYGWYNLEQLQAWARNEGPIPIVGPHPM